MGFYLYYLYSTSKNKKDFAKSPFYQSISVALVLFLISFISINIFISDPEKESRIKVEKKTDIDELIADDQEMLKKAEISFMDPNIHYKFINHHFEIPEHWKDKYGQYMERDDFTIVNYYLDKLSSVDSSYINNARIALGIFYFKKDSLNKSLSYFNSIHVPFPFVKYFKAKIYYQLDDIDNAINHYKLAK